MDEREVLKAFINANIHFQRDGLKRFNEILGTRVDKNLLHQLVTYASELQYKLMDAEKVDKIIDFVAKGKQQKSTDQAKIIKDQINQSIIVLDYFNQNRFIIQSTAKDKQLMALNRLKNIEKLLRQDNRYVFGYVSNEAISISQIGTVIGSIDKTHIILGLLFQIRNNYYVSDGMIQLRINIQHAQNRYMFTNFIPDKADIGLININSVVILTGQWDDHNGCFDVFSFSVPNFNVKKELKEQILNTDLKGRRKLDRFGVYDKMVECFFAEQIPNLERQKALNVFINTQSESVWVLSNFSLDSLVAIKTFDSLLNQYQIFCNERNLAAPSLIILVGQFSTQSIPKQDILYGNELVKMLTQYQEYLKKTLIFFVPSYDDFPLAYSLPKTPLNLRLYMQEPMENMHSVCNPCKLSICGYNVVIVRNDISKEIRKNHIQSMQADHKHVSETIISQQYVGSFNNQQVCYKWNYDEAMQLDPTVDLVVFCDQTIAQYKYQTLINETLILNPGNFLKGEFGTIKVNKKRQTISCDTSKIEI